MCEHHHAAKQYTARNATCWWFYPPLAWAKAAYTMRATLTTEWGRARQRPTAYALAALFMLLLNLFPSKYECRGRHQRSHASGNPRRQGVFEDYASPARSFIICPTGAGILPGDHSITCQPRQFAAVGKTLASDLFLLKSWGMAEILRRGVGQFCC